jgi:hypothetical protein
MLVLVKINVISEGFITKMAEWKIRDQQSGHVE